MHIIIYAFLRDVNVCNHICIYTLRHVSLPMRMYITRMHIYIIILRVYTSIRMYKIIRDPHVCICWVIICGNHVSYVVIVRVIVHHRDEQTHHNDEQIIFITRTIITYYIRVIAHISVHHTNDYHILHISHSTFQCSSHWYVLWQLWHTAYESYQISVFITRTIWVISHISADHNDDFFLFIMIKKFIVMMNKCICYHVR